MQLIDGKKTAQSIKEEIALSVQEIKAKKGKIPHLAAVIVGEDPASKIYVNHKVKACAKVGFNSTLIELPTDITEEQLLFEVDLLNKDEDIDGFIVQLPLPDHIDEQKVIMAVKPEKDVDGFHPVNIGKMTLELPGLLPATPFGIMELLKRYEIGTTGKHVVVVGRSHIVGRPISILLSQKRDTGNATVTLAHSRTKNLKEITRQADILIAAIGKARFITPDMVKNDVVVIDVGTNSIPDDSRKSGQRLVGDVDFDTVSKKASYITPVPGGVGPMTIAMLLKNTLTAAQKNET